MPDLEREMRFAARVYDAVAAAIGELQSPKYAEGKNETHLLAVLMLGRAATALYSALLLFRAGLERDASTVTRTIIELDIDLRWILAKDTEARTRRYFRFGDVVMFRHFERFLNLAPELDLGDRRAFLRHGDLDLYEQAKKARDEVADEFTPNGNQWTAESLWQRAKDVGLQLVYQIEYAFCCGAAHSNAESVEAGADFGEHAISIHVGPQRPTHRLPLLFASQRMISIALVALPFLGLNPQPLADLAGEWSSVFSPENTP